MYMFFFFALFIFQFIVYMTSIVNIYRSNNKSIIYCCYVHIIWWKQLTTTTTKNTWILMNQFTQFSRLNAGRKINRFMMKEVEVVFYRRRRSFFFLLYVYVFFFIHKKWQHKRNEKHKIKLIAIYFFHY